MNPPSKNLGYYN